MKKALAKIKETAEEIRERLKSETQIKRQNRLQSLYLIVTKQAKSRRRGSKLRGFNRNTISDWLRLYEEKGLEKMLESYQPSGAAAKMTEAVVEEIKELLGRENGFRTYKESHQRVVKKHKIKVAYSIVHNLVRYKLTATAKSPRPSNPKKTKPQEKNSRRQARNKSKQSAMNTGRNIQPCACGRKMKRALDCCQAIANGSPEKVSDPSSVRKSNASMSSCLA